MSQLSRPFLVEFSAVPRSDPQTPELEVDAVTGMLRRPCSSTPFVEELLAAEDSRCRVVASTATVITESGGDSPDPDLLRTDLQWAVAFAMTTVCTKVEPDQPDPDLVRASLE
jgi:hypothetical protein